MSRYTSLALGGAVAVAALVPLYGEIRASHVSHPEWARMLVRVIHPSEVAESTTQASQAFATLSWRQSLSYPAERYYRAEKVSVQSDDGATCVTGDGTTGEVAYRLGIVRAGHYRLRARVKGVPSQAVVTNVARLGDGTSVGTYDVVPAPVLGWVDANARAGVPWRLSPGGYVASFLVPQGTCLSQVEIVPPCLQPIEPLGGWQARAVTQAADVAATLLKALDLEWELPPAASAIERPGSDFEIDESSGHALAVQATAGPEMSWLRGGPGGTRAYLILSLPEDGLYNIAVLGRFPAAQRWGLDSCFENLLCPAPEGEGLRWRSVATLSMMAGRHFVSVELAPNTVVARVKIERKKAAAEDYVATLRRLGFDAGSEGPINRPLAASAIAFLKSRQATLDVGRCKDSEFIFPDAPGTQVAGRDVPAFLQPVQTAANQPPPEAGQGLPPILAPPIDPVITVPTPPTPEPPVESLPTALPPTPLPPTPTPPTPTPPTPTPPTPTPTATPTPPTPPPTPTCASPPCP
jgi:hypothetical protein